MGMRWRIKQRCSIRGDFAKRFLGIFVSRRSRSLTLNQPTKHSYYVKITFRLGDRDLDYHCHHPQMYHDASDMTRGIPWLFDPEKWPRYIESLFQLWNHRTHFTFLSQFIASITHSWRPRIFFSKRRIENDSSTSLLGHRRMVLCSNTSERCGMQTF